ncbi:MAG: signal peptide peptidase SppA [Myxococcaceae bacterium]
MGFVLSGFINLLRALAWGLLLPMRLARAMKRPAFVRFKLSGDLPFREGFGRRRWWRRAPLSLDRFTRELAEVARDAHVVGVLIEVEHLRLSSAKIEVIRDVIATLKAAGKRVVGRSSHAGNPEYEVLSACSEVVLPKTGRLDVLGYAIEVNAVAPFFKRLGVTAEFFRRGEWKTAPEFFTNATISVPRRQALEAILDERYETLVDRIARGRGQAPDEVRRTIDAGPHRASRALSAKLVDALVGDADLDAHLTGQKLPEVSRAVASFAEHRACKPWAMPTWRPMRRLPTIAVVPLVGMIVPGDGGQLPGGLRAVGGRTLVRTLKRLERERTEAVMLYVASPGGAAPPSEDIREAVARLAQEKPVVAYCDKVAASGGYLAALGAKEIWAGHGAIVGSIGVYAGRFEASGLLQRAGVHREIISRGAHAALSTWSRPLTESERAALDGEVGDTYAEFVNAVATARRLSREDVLSRAEGRVFTAKAALDAKLIDGLGSFDAAAQRALALANVPGRAFRTRWIETRARPWRISQAIELATQVNLWAVCPDAWTLQSTVDTPWFGGRGWAA